MYRGRLPSLLDNFYFLFLLREHLDRNSLQVNFFLLSGRIQLTYDTAQALYTPENLHQATGLGISSYDKAHGFRALETSFSIHPTYRLESFNQSLL